jgi:hypothetical protein
MAIATSECHAPAVRHRTESEDPRATPGRDEPSGRIRGTMALIVALAPAVAAIWAVPWFITQDTPAHVYNAEVLARSFDRESPFAGIFAIRWQPIPNWVGHILLAGLLRLVPAWAADRIMTSATLVGFAASAFWLRLRIAKTGATARGAMGHWPAALLAALLAMNITWLFGFTSFTLGVCLFPVTLGFWWPRRDRVGPGGIAGLWLLLVLGYFCHLVSLGLTVLGLGLLALTSPMPPAPAGAFEGSRWRRVRTRLIPLGIAFLPLIPLGLLYLGLAHRAGPMHPVWNNLPDPRSLSGWKSQLTWADPITLARKDALPFTERVGAGFIVFAPAFWLVAALGVWAVARAWGRLRDWPARDSPGAVSPACAGPAAAADRRGWWLLAAFLILGGLASPDTLGPEHGNYLPQRVVLCGLVALAAAIEIDPRRRAGRIAAAGLAAAVVLQSAIVWDYALYSDRTAGEIVRARAAVGRGRRVAYLPASLRSRFRANPLLHVDNWLGVGTGNVVWGNYETRHYYFPVQFRPGIDRPRPEELERLALLDAPGEAADRARRWEGLLARHADAIDVLVTYKHDPRLDAVSARWFREVGRRGDVRILVRDRGAEALGPESVGPRRLPTRVAHLGSGRAAPVAHSSPASSDFEIRLPVSATSIR